ncbi:hypothetical protein OG893_20080 [Streptomyces sp. NBC_01696]|uniref:hypothetical protein n=1 Tax=Streptomyces sp. NBC_01696 TaxID=2975913 RepID=UPI002E372E6A|nr:hypothetical protein [Streptomyces sp. NBC_01696]
MVLGDTRYLRLQEESSGLHIDDLGVEFAKKSLGYETIQEGLAGLSQEVLESEAPDLARATALGLVACSAAAELDDYARCDGILDHLIDLSRLNEFPSTLLIRAILLQQKSLRLWDSSRDFKHSSIDALQSLEGVTVSDLPTFENGPYASPSDTLEHVVLSVRRAIWSLAPLYRISVGEEQWPGFPDRDSIMRSPQSEDVLRVAAGEAEAYAKFVEQSFKAQYRSRSRYIFGGPQTPDIFSQTLALELLGHSSVRESRKNLALLRLVQVDNFGNLEQVRDALRLLRQAGADKELSLAVEKLRAGGPLWALGEDARQILRNRRTSNLLRAPELRVLRGAAELLTVVEARRALQLVREVLLEGGPASISGRWQRDSDRIGNAWLTMARLSRFAEQVDGVGEYFIDTSSQTTAQEDFDDALSRAVAALDWDAASKASMASWRRWLETTGSHWIKTAEVVAENCAVSDSHFDEAPGNLAEVAVHVNRMLRGIQLPSDMISSIFEVVTEGLRQVISEARSGVHSFRIPAPAEIAAALISRADAPLWDDLVMVLLNSAVTRDQTDRAFEWLTNELPHLPEKWESEFMKQAKAILTKGGEAVEAEGEITPYPEGLRFLAAYQLIDDDAVFSNVAKLAGDVRISAREEAARTAALLAERRSDTWILALVMQLSHDSHVSTRAHAARGLAHFAARDQRPSAASHRIVELLAEDGVEVPIRVLSALRKIEFPLNQNISSQVDQLANEHPSRAVRDAANSVILN